MDIVLILNGYDFVIGPIVERECQPSCQDHLDAYIREGKLRRIPDAQIPTSLFLNYLQRFRLGDGETECLVICSMLGSDVATDDSAARRAAEDLFGEDRVTGSIGLLKVAVNQTLLTPDDGKRFYLEMRHQGAFLPELGTDFF